jgi:alkaline phosphatase
MKKYFSNTLFLLLVLSFTACDNIVDSAEGNPDNTPEVKNIIFLIGDGMGVNQLFAAIDETESILTMEKAEFSGFSKTNSLTHKITDSAAGGTALATGNKTKNGVIGQDTTGTVFKTILEYAEDNGLSTGLISTSSITHATPASFIAHEVSRNNYEAIAADFLNTEIDLFIGGGYKHFAERSDGVNLIDSLKAKDYFIARDMKEVMSSDATKIAGLLAEVHLPPALQGRDDMLPEATSKAIEILSNNSEGFFLMVEGSQIDWGGHANDYEYVLSETLDFDKAVEVAVKFAEKTPGTLVVVTSDHETGGLTLPSREDNYTITAPHFATGGHSASLVPVFSYGDGAGRFSGILDNTDFFPRFMELYGFEEE